MPLPVITHSRHQFAYTPTRHRPQAEGLAPAHLPIY